MRPCYAKHLRGVNESGLRYNIAEPASEIWGGALALSKLAHSEPHTFLKTLLGDEIVHHEACTGAFAQALQALDTHGVRDTMKRYEAFA